MALYYLSLALSGSLLAPFLFFNKIDLIFVYQPSPITVGVPALVLKWLENLPIIIWVQDIWPETLAATGMVRSETLLKLIGRLVRLIYRSCDRVLVQSRAFAKRIESLGVSSARIFYLPNTAESLYRPLQVSQDAPEQKLMPKGFRLVFAGNIGKAQDFPTMLSAAEKLKAQKNIHWIILGDGTMRSWVEKRIKDFGLGETVHLLGKYPPERMPYFFSLSDALLVLLKDEFIFSLTIPSKVQAYLACGRPIIAALNGEGATVIEESGAGMTVPSGNSEALAQTVIKMYSMSQEERNEMGRRGRDYSQDQFSREKTLDRIEAWMTEEVHR
jgi:glycosyltransferase involved in cell wall biosynthesis